MRSHLRGIGLAAMAVGLQLVTSGSANAALNYTGQTPQNVSVQYVNLPANTQIAFVNEINGATFAFQGTAQGALKHGLVLTAISNTAATPIAGTFANLPDGAILTVNGNNFQASYEGGDGNDLTLTVIP